MAQKAFAINDFVLDNHTGLTGPAKVNATIRSHLEGGIGLPAARADLSQRYGFWPRVSGLRRPGHGLTLTSRFMACTPAERYVQRRDLLAELNPELEIPARLMVADQVAPEGLIVALGPWDVYVDDSGNWHCRDPLWERGGDGVAAVRVEADINNAVAFREGQYSRQNAIVVDPAVTNMVLDPTVEAIAAPPWGAINGAAEGEVTDVVKFGGKSAQMTTDADLEGFEFDLSALASAIHTASVWIYGEIPTGGLQVSLDAGGNWHQLVAAGTEILTEWTRYTVEIPAAQANGSTRFWIVQDGAGATFIWYVDGAQVEQRAYATSVCAGSFGPGYSWSGAAHNSTSARTATEIDLDSHVDLVDRKDTLSFRIVFRVPLDATGTWPVAAHVFDVFNPTGSARIYIRYNDVSVAWEVRLDDGPTAVTWSSAVQSFSAGDWVDIVLTLDFNGTGAGDYRIYVDGTLSATDTTANIEAPEVSSWSVGSEYDGTDQIGYHIAEYMVWNRVLTAGEVSALNANGATAGRARYLNVLCESSRPLTLGGTPTDLGQVSNLSVDGEVRWRSQDGDVDFLRVYDDTWYKTVVVDSDDDVWPVFRIEPTLAKDADTGFAYKAFVRVEWNAPTSASKYPIVVIMDTATPIPAKMQADGDDLRVFVNGSETDRWLNDINTGTTEIWFNLDFGPTQGVTLGVAIGAGDTVTEVEVAEDEDISGYPGAGILLIDSEEFYYADKNDTDGKFLEVTRAVRGTAAAAHTITDTIYLIQHDVVVVYGNTTLDAPVVNDDDKPEFELSSTNGTWTYSTWTAAKRNMEWVSEVLAAADYIDSDSGELTFNESSILEIKNRMWRGGSNFPAMIGQSIGRWKVQMPIGYTTAVLTGINDNVGVGFVVVRLQVQTATGGGVWVLYSTTPVGGFVVNVVDASGDLKWVSLYSSITQTQGDGVSAYNLADGNITNCVFTLYAANVPVATIGAERANYSLNVTIKNETTGESMVLDFPIMEVDEILEVDTYQHTITYLQEGSRQQQALKLSSGARRDWLRLVRGANVLLWDDTGSNKVEVDILWNRRDEE